MSGAVTRYQQAQPVAYNLGLSVLLSILPRLMDGESAGLISGTIFYECHIILQNLMNNQMLDDTSD